MKREHSYDWPAQRSLIIKVAVSVGVSVLAIVVYLVAPASIGTGVSRGETEATPSPRVMQSDSPELTESKAELNAIVKEFIPRYFNRDASLTVAEHRERLQGFVTETFLENQAIGLTTKQDRALIQENARIQAVPGVETPLGHLSADGSTAEVEAIVTITKLAADGTEVSSGEFLQPMTLVKTESGWRVESLF